MLSLTSWLADGGFLECLRAFWASFLRVSAAAGLFCVFDGSRVAYDVRFDTSSGRLSVAIVSGLRAAISAVSSIELRLALTGASLVGLARDLPLVERQTTLRVQLTAQQFGTGQFRSSSLVCQLPASLAL